MADEKTINLWREAVVTTRDDYENHRDLEDVPERVAAYIGALESLCASYEIECAGRRT